MPSRRRSRERALQMTYQWDTSGAEPDKVVHDFFEWMAADGPLPVDPFAERLFLAVTESKDELDSIIERHASRRWAPERLAQIVRQLLRLAICEMRLEDTPALVVIDEALEIGKRFDGGESTAFVNGILEAARSEMTGGASPRRRSAKRGSKRGGQGRTTRTR